MLQVRQFWVCCFHILPCYKHPFLGKPRRSGREGSQHLESQIAFLTNKKASVRDLLVQISSATCSLLGHQDSCHLSALVIQDAIGRIPFAKGSYSVPFGLPPSKLELCAKCCPSPMFLAPALLHYLLFPHFSAFWVTTHPYPTPLIHFVS